MSKGSPCFGLGFGGGGGSSPRRNREVKWVESAVASSALNRDNAFKSPHRRQMLSKHSCDVSKVGLLMRRLQRCSGAKRIKREKVGTEVAPAFLLFLVLKEALDLVHNLSTVHRNVSLRHFCRLRLVSADTLNKFCETIDTLTPKTSDVVYKNSA